MQYVKFTLLMIALLTVNILAQDSDFSLEDLKAPSMPSATIIGLQVNEINQPKSLKALETSIFSNYFDSDFNLNIPENYAMEINPYMIGGSKNLDYRDYLKDDAGSNITRNFSFSISSTNKFPLLDSSFVKALGFGFRTIIFNGHPSDTLSKQFDWVYGKDMSEDDIKGSVLNLIQYALLNETPPPSDVDAMKNYVHNKLDNANQLDKSVLVLIDNIFNNINSTTPVNKIEDEFERLYENEYSLKRLKKFKELLKEIKNNRYGLRCEIDLAAAVVFPTNEFNVSTVPRWGFWTNLSYSTEKLENFTLILLLRYLSNNNDYLDKYMPIDDLHIPDNSIDFGGRLVFEKNKFSIETEVVGRRKNERLIRIIDDEEWSRNETNTTCKYILNINYNIADNITVSYNIGKNFDDLDPSSGDLISGLSVNFGFGDIKASDLVKEK